MIFFVQTPGKNIIEDRVDFYPVDVDFGGAIQKFHIGKASVAVPGTVAGLFAIHEKYGSLPMNEVVKPAVQLARNGFVVDGFQAFTFELLEPIFKATPESVDIYGKTETELVGDGDILQNKDLANTIEFLAEQGPKEFYQGEIAQRIEEVLKDGGYIQKDDLVNYQVKERVPLSLQYKGKQFWTNPLPSAGGTLIGFALKLLEGIDLKDVDYKSAEYITILQGVMQKTQLARQEKLDGHVYEKTLEEEFFSIDYLSKFRKAIQEHLNRFGSTTHMSVVDNEGNVASLTASNGEGSGIIIPGTGIILNNMLGEEDLNPEGFHRWPTSKRLSSMMAPSIIEDGNKIVVLGSAGANRIRSAILQTIVRLFDYNLSLEEAVNGPRLHFENDKLDLEPGFSKDSLTKIKQKEIAEKINIWNEKSLFFGGANCVSLDKTNNKLSAVGDVRRDGLGIAVN